MNLSIRFLIGLHTAADSIHLAERARQVDERRKRALLILSGAYSGFTSWRGTGEWKGKTEPCLVVETVLPIRYDGVDDVTSERVDRITARTVARDIARALGQESVMVVFQTVETEFVGP